MKKLTVMLLIAAMVLGVSACGNSANKGNTATESQMSTPVSYTHLTLPTKA